LFQSVGEETEKASEAVRSNKRNDDVAAVGVVVGMAVVVVAVVGTVVEAVGVLVVIVWVVIVWE